MDMPADTSLAVADQVFPLRGGALPADHAWALAEAVRAFLPWWDDEPEAGILPISGLSRSEAGCLVSGRARLVLRLPLHRLASADSLAGQRLPVGDGLELGTPASRPIQAARGVVYSHFVCADTDDEIVFVERCKAELAARGLQPQLITGKARRLATPEGVVHGFSLMLHGLGPQASIALQEAGLGRHRALGCGIFVPHKSVAAVGGE